jgi:hypothetical protein
MPFRTAAVPQVEAAACENVKCEAAIHDSFCLVGQGTCTWHGFACVYCQKLWQSRFLLHAPSHLPSLLSRCCCCCCCSPTMLQTHPKVAVHHVAPAPAPAPAPAHLQVVVVAVPHHCKVWAKFGHMHPDCKQYHRSAGHKL